MNGIQTEGLAAIIAIVVSALGAWATLRKAKADATNAATALYRELCASQQHRIDVLTARVVALENEKDELVARYTKEIEGLEAQLNDLREALAGKDREIARLQERVSELESERAQLKAELAQLRQQRRPVGAR